MRRCGPVRQGRNAGIGTQRRPTVTGMLFVVGIHRDHHVKLVGSAAGERHMMWKSAVRKRRYAVASQSRNLDATTRRPSVTRPTPAALDSAGHERLLGRTLAQWGKDRMSEMERSGGGTWCLFSQYSCFGNRGSAPAAWREHASHPPQLLNRGAVLIRCECSSGRRGKDGGQGGMGRSPCRI